MLTFPYLSNSLSIFPQGKMHTSVAHDCHFVLWMGTSSSSPWGFSMAEKKVIINCAHFTPEVLYILLVYKTCVFKGYLTCSRFKHNTELLHSLVTLDDVFLTSFSSMRTTLIQILKDFWIYITTLLQANNDNTEHSYSINWLFFSNYCGGKLLGSLTVIRATLWKGLSGQDTASWVK